MGAVVMSGAIAEAMAPGDHGTTFGGGPLVASVARTVLETLGEADFLDGVRLKGECLRRGLEQVAAANPGCVAEIRGRGLLWGAELSRAAGPVIEEAREGGLLTVPAGSRVIRLLPPLTVRRAEIDDAVEILAGAIGTAARAA